MAERKTEIGKQGRAGTPISINYDTGVGQAFKQTSVTLANIANTLADEADRRSVIQAQREGTQVGAFGVPNLRDEGTISGEAFNRSAIQSYTNRLELQSRNTLSRIEKEHAADPSGFAAASRSYMKGVSEEIQGVAPWLVPTFQQRYLLQEQAGLAKVSNTYAGLARDSARADVFNLTGLMKRDHEENASTLFSGDINESTGQVSRMLQDIQRIDGAMSQVGPDGLPLFSKLEKEKQLQAMRDNMYVSGVKGYITKNGSSFETVQDLIDGKTEFKIQQFDKDGKPTGETVNVNIRQELSDDKYQGLIQYAKSQLVFENQVANAREKEYNDLLKKEQESNAVLVWSRIEGRVDPETGDRVTPISIPEVVDLAQSGEIKGDEAIQMIKAIEVPGVDVSEVNTKVMAQNMIYQGQDATTFINQNRDKLTTQDTTSLLIENTQLQTGAPKMATLQRQQLFNSMGVTGPLEAINPVAERRRNNALTEYDLRVREGEDPIVVRRDIESRVEIGGFDTGATAVLVKPRYFVPGPTPNTIDVSASARALQDKYKNGEVSNQSFVRQFKLLEDWKILQPKPKSEQTTTGNQ